MQLLFVHSDHLEFEVTTEVGEDLAETEGVPMEGRMEDCVTVFASVEREDEADLDAAVENAASEVRDVATQLNTRKAVLYPYAHLSDDLADPDSATAVLQDLQAELDADFEVLRAPFGWYKAFEIASKGHPISELSRHVTPEREGKDDADSERAPSEWKLVFPDGEICDPTEAKHADRVSDDLRALIEAAVDGKTADEGDQPPQDDQPLHVELVQEQKLAGDDLGDAGTLRWYPRGKLVRDSLVEYVDDLAVDYGGMPVETPASDEFGACAGPLSVLRDADPSERDLPLRIYEPSADSFRRERRDEGERRDGSERWNEDERQDEVTDLTRQRRSATPEMHTATADLEQAKDELRAQAKLSLRASADLGLNYVPTIRLIQEFYDDNGAWVESLVSDLGTPALLEILPERRHCWSVQLDFATIDGLGRPIENATVQIDVESAERFDIEYSAGEDADGAGEDADDADGDEQYRHPPILHCSPSGDIERVLAALLERAAQLETPRLPTWLSPTQVRFIPVGEAHVEYCDALAEDFESEGIRADVDERDETVGKRIARAESDWVPYYAVVGDREMGGRDDGGAGDEPLEVNVRAEDEVRKMDFEELRTTVLDDVGDLPKKRRYLTKHVSKHPDFTSR